MNLQFHFAVLTLMAFVTLAVAGHEDLHNHLKLAPLPTQAQMRAHHNAEAVLYVFAVNGEEIVK
jgi:hypothetical protein